MKLSVADYTFPLLRHEQVLELVSWLELDGVDLGLMGNRSHIRPESIVGDPTGAARQTRARLQTIGLDASDVFLIPWTDFESFAPNHPSADERSRARELFDTALEFAAGVGALGMTTLPGIFWPGETREAGLARAAEELTWRVERARSRGLRLSVEPHVGSLIESPALTEELLSKSPGLELTLDPSHFVFQGLDDAAWIGLVPHARHIHVRGAAPARMQTTVSASTIDLAALMRAAQQTGYRGYIALEYVWTDWERCNETDNISETVLLRDQLRELLRK